MAYRARRILIGALLLHDLLDYEERLTRGARGGVPQCTVEATWPVGRLGLELVGTVLTGAGAPEPHMVTLRLMLVNQGVVLHPDEWLPTVVDGQGRPIAHTTIGTPPLPADPVLGQWMTEW